MKKLFLIFVIFFGCVLSTFAIDKNRIETFEQLYELVESDDDLDYIECKYESLQKIWNYAVFCGKSYIDYKTVKDLLLNPTELPFLDASGNEIILERIEG